MTISIGLLCDRGNSIILAADTMISYGSVSSNQGGNKIYDLPLGLFAAVADDVSQTHIFISKLADDLRTLYATDPALLDHVKLACKNTATYAFKWMRSEILASIGLTDDEFLHDTNLASDLRARAERLIDETPLPIDILVGGYGGAHTIFLQVDGTKIIEQTSPGVFVAGSGGSAAIHWLNFRRQNVDCARARSYAHLIEAVTFAKLSPYVGPQFRALLLMKGKAEPIKLSELGNEWVNDCKSKIWVRPTDYLDSEAERASFDVAFGIK